MITESHELFADPRRFVRELRSVVGQHWMLLAAADRLQRPGDYAARWFGEASVAVVVGPDGVRRGFHNFCLHSAFATLLTSEGNCGTEIACPVHGWRYGLDGRLLMPAGQGTLLPAQFLERGGIVFAHPGVQPGDLDADLTAAARALLDDGRLAEHATVDVQLGVNWKVVVTALIASVGDACFAYPASFYVPEPTGLAVLTVRPNYLARTAVTVHMAGHAAGPVRSLLEDWSERVARLDALADVHQIQIPEFYARLDADLDGGRGIAAR